MNSRRFFWPVLIVGSALAMNFVCLSAVRLRAAEDVEPIISLLELLLSDQTSDVETTQKCLAIVAGKIQNRELPASEVVRLQPRLDALLKPALTDAKHPLHGDVVLLAANWKNAAATDAARKLLVSADRPAELRLQAAEALLAAADAQAVAAVGKLLTDGKSLPKDVRGKLIAALGRSEDPRVADAVLAAYATLEPELQPKAVELLTQRPSWGKALMLAVDAKQVPAGAIGVNQMRKLVEGKDPQVLGLVKKHLGAVRTERNPQREQVIEQVRTLLKTTPAGDPLKGRQVFVKLCGQCHKIYGEGQEVGPEITANGRASYEQLLSNVLDPSLVIGPAYQAVDVRTADGRVLTGLIAEDSPQRLVLKLQGGKTETIARDDVEETHLSKLSLMPEGVEKQLKPEELVDLFAFLILDRPPEDPSAKLLPGAGEVGSKAKK